MEKPQLLIMAAGLGSRYGGLKQIDPVDDQGQLIIDYSIYDALRAGFGKVVCVINEKNRDLFEEVIGSRVRNKAQIEYAYQDMNNLPKGFTLPEGRVKPWGTAHAVLCAKDAMTAPFSVINADDFYGPGAFQEIYDFLSAPHKETEHAMVGYQVENTLTENGHVARGVCQVKDGFLTGITERTHIEPRVGGAAFTEDDGKTFTFLPNGTTVSMNMWGFQTSILPEIEGRFAGYLRENLPINPLKCEYFLPLIPNQLLNEGKATVRVLPTVEKWYGVTYHDDKPRVQSAIADMKKRGLYPDNLWR